MYNMTMTVDRIKQSAKKMGITMTYLCKVLGKRASFLSDVRCGKDSIDDTELAIIADKLETTVEYLKGETDNPKNADSDNGNRLPPTEENIKVALFGGDKEVTDEMWDEVKNFIEYVKSRNNRK